ncbi:MAG: tetratricopeptide repeat protein [Oricola sp.]
MTANYLSVDQALNLARTRANRGALDDAKRAYRWILDKIPDHKRALEGLRALQEPNDGTKLPQEADKAMALYRQGRLEEAQSRVENLVARYPRSAALHNLLGSIEAGLGQQMRAIGSFRRAAALQPDLIEARLNLGSALNDIGRHSDAADVFALTTRERPLYADAYVHLGKALQALGRYAEAAESHKQAIGLEPGFAKAYTNLGRALVALGDMRTATQNFAQAAQIDPASGEAHSSLGLALTALGRPQDGIKACRKAIDLSPGDAQAHVDLAAALDGLGDPDAAIDSLKRALELKPDHAGAYSDLCGIFERTRQQGDFRATLKKARQACGESDPRILYRMAQLAESDDAPQTARRILEKIPEAGLPTSIAAGRLMLFGKISDRLGEYAEAFEFARRANDMIKATPLAQSLDPAAFLREIEALTVSFASLDEKPWTAEPDTGMATPVFMVGFPGATNGFIDSMLADHPAITVVEDKPMVARMRALIGGPTDGDRLEALSPGDIEALREAYFNELYRHAGNGAENGVVIDKLPLNIVHAGLINRVFPSAKFVFAAHHPCNIVLSCFMREFWLDAATANFLDLETTATFYDRVVRLWAAYRKLLRLDVLTLSCEAPLGDRRETVRSLLGFLDLDPSYLLIERGRTAPQWWENYRPQLEPVLPLLESWARNSDI